MYGVKKFWEGNVRTPLWEGNVRTPGMPPVVKTQDTCVLQRFQAGVTGVRGPVAQDSESEAPPVQQGGHDQDVPPVVTVADDVEASWNEMECFWLRCHGNKSAGKQQPRKSQIFRPQNCLFLFV